MTALVLTRDNVALMKDALREHFADVKSAHLTEALAYSVNHRTHASLLAAMDASDPEWPDVALLDKPRFLDRIGELGYALRGSTRSRRLFENLGVPIFKMPTEQNPKDAGSMPKEAVLIKTESLSRDGKKISLNSAKSKAWRNMMVSAVNAGIEQKLFHILPGTNRWPGYSPDYYRSESPDSFTYDFTFGDNVPAIARVRSISWDELSIHVALWPTPDGRSRIGVMNAGFRAGEAWASGWLERRVGSYLQTSSDFCCRRRHLSYVAEAKVSPKGYGDRGKVHM